MQHHADSNIGSPKNWFKSLWDSRVPPDSLGVNDSFNFSHVIVIWRLIIKVQKKTISVRDQNYNMPFLKNEFSKSCKDFFTIS